MRLATGGAARHSPGQSNYLLTTSLWNMFVQMAMSWAHGSVLARLR
jgi:hypothetical protein